MDNNNNIKNFAKHLSNIMKNANSNQVTLLSFRKYCI